MARQQLNLAKNYLFKYQNILAEMEKYVY